MSSARRLLAGPASSARRGVLISGGGTAGHVLPGLAIGRELTRRGVVADDIHFVGSERGIETTLVPEAGFPLTVLPGRGIARRFTWDNVGAVIGLLRAVGRAALLVRRLRPTAVVALGGYASVPCVLWAWVFRVPVIVAEQNAVPGLANRLSAKVARASAVSFRGTDLPRAEWTGNPIRDEIVAVDREGGRAEARALLGIAPDRRLVAVFGGSLGARRINTAVVGSLAEWRDRSDLAIRHVIGDRDFAAVTADVPDLSGAALHYVPVRYETDMPTLYAGADLVCCRAGATSVAELAMVGCPAVLVPLPGAPGDHQTANARALASVGAAVLVPDPELTPERFMVEVDALLGDPDRLTAMAGAGAAVARPDAAARVVDLVERWSRV